MDASVKLKSAISKLQRANFHIATLDREIKSFFNSSPFEILIKTDIESRKVIYCVGNDVDLPLSFNVIIGDALFNLRSALDHLAWQFFQLSTKTITPESFYFPIFNGTGHYTKTFQGKVAGFRPQDIEFIVATKPYKGGNDALWIIHELNRLDKHRLLLQASGAYFSLGIGNEAIARALDAFRPKMPAKGLRFMEDALRSGAMQVFVDVSNPVCPLKSGAILRADPPGTKPYLDEESFGFGISIQEPSFPNPKPQSAVAFLGELANCVDGILSSAAKLLV
jgi:hypothetical protein